MRTMLAGKHKRRRRGGSPAQAVIACNSPKTGPPNRNEWLAGGFEKRSQLERALPLVEWDSRREQTSRRASARLVEGVQSARALGREGNLEKAPRRLGRMQEHEPRFSCTDKAAGKPPLFPPTGLLRVPGAGPWEVFSGSGAVVRPLASGNKKALWSVCWRIQEDSRTRGRVVGFDQCQSCRMMRKTHKIYGLVDGGLRWASKGWKQKADRGLYIYACGLPMLSPGQGSKAREDDPGTRRARHAPCSGLG